MKPRAKITLIAFALIVAAAVFLAPVVRVKTFATDVTASTMTDTSYFGLPAIVTRHTSPLAEWCRLYHVAVDEKSVPFSGINRNLWGRVFSRGCGQPPVSYQFTPNIQATWLAHAPEADIRRFVADMAKADAAGRKRLVETVIRQTIAAQ